MELEFSRQNSEKNQIWNLFKIRPVGAELFHADGQTDMNLIIAFRNFANVPKKQLLRINLCCTKSWRTILDSASVPPLHSSLTLIISELLSDLINGIQVTAFCPKNGIWSEKKKHANNFTLVYVFWTSGPKRPTRVTGSVGLLSSHSNAQQICNS
jgi:hypothetical protein